MKVTELTKLTLRTRRENRAMKTAGYERVDDRGGKLWELHRGGRWREVIKDVVIAVDGKSLWVRVGEPDVL